MSINHIELIPFYFLSLFYFLNKRNTFSLVLSALVFALLFNADAYYAFFSGIFSIILMVLYQPAPFRQKVKLFLVYYGVLFMVLFLANFNFVISNWYLFDPAKAAATGRHSDPRGELDRTLYFFAPYTLSFLHMHLPYLGDALYIVIPLIVILGGFFSRRDRLYLSLLSCFLLAAILSTYIPDLFWLNRLYFRFFGMFRSIGRIILLAYLSLGLLAGMTLAKLAHTDAYKRLPKAAALLITLLLGAIVVVAGMNADPTWKKNTNMAQLAALYEPIFSNTSIKVIAAYPMVLNFVTTGFPQPYQLIGQTLHMKALANGATLGSSVGGEYMQKINTISDPRTIDQLTHYGVDTILIYNNFPQLGENSTTINARLQKDSRLIFVGRYTAERDPGYVSESSLSRDISVYQIKAVVEQNQHAKARFSLSDPNATVDYKQLRPYQYRITLSHLSQPTQLIFDAPYTEKWKLFAGNFSRTDELAFLLNLTIPLAGHTRVNEYANRWSIDLEDLLARFPGLYTIGQDGKGSIELTLYFGPQSWYFLGCIISGLTWVIGILYLIWKRFTR